MVTSTRHQSVKRRKELLTQNKENKETRELCKQFFFRNSPDLLIPYPESLRFGNYFPSEAPYFQRVHCFLGLWAHPLEPQRRGSKYDHRVIPYLSPLPPPPTTPSTRHEKESTKWKASLMRAWSSSYIHRNIAIVSNTFLRWQCSKFMEGAICEGQISIDIKGSFGCGMCWRSSNCELGVAVSESEVGGVYSDNCFRLDLTLFIVQSDCHRLDRSGKIDFRGLHTIHIS